MTRKYDDLEQNYFLIFMLLMRRSIEFPLTLMRPLADVNSGSGLHPLLDSLQRYVPLVSNPFIQVLGHFLCLQGVPKSCQQNPQDNVGKLDFWTTLGHPGYFGEVGPLWPKNRVSQH